MWEYKHSILLKLLLQVALGIGFFHKAGLIHGDIKGENIVVSDDGEKITLVDYDSSVVEEKNDYTEYGGTLPWTAPERIKKTNGEIKFNRPTYKSDIYSFGMLCYEILSGMEPFYEQDDLSSKIIAIKRFGPKIPDDFPEEFVYIIKECIKKEPLERPDIEDVIKYLQDLNKIKNN